MNRTPILITAAGFATLTVGCAQVATVEGPNHRQQLGSPASVAVNLGKAANPDTFTATVNGTDITESFAFDGNAGELTGYVFEPAPGREPHTLTLAAEPAINAKGKPMGQPFSETLTFFPPAVKLQGNVGIGVRSHVAVPRDGRTSVMLKLPSAVTQPTTFIVEPVPAAQSAAEGVDPAAMTNCVALNDHDAGQAVEVTVKPGNRVAVFTVRGQEPGITALRVESPGYVAADIKVFVDRPTVTAAVTTR